MSLVSMQTNRWVAKIVTITQAFGERARVSEGCNGGLGIYFPGESMKSHRLW